MGDKEAIEQLGATLHGARERAEKLMRTHGDVEGSWHIKFPGGTKVVKGPLSQALLEAAYFTNEFKTVKVVDEYGGSSFKLVG